MAPMMTVSPASALPPLEQAVELRGGYAIIDGANAGAVDGLVLAGAGVTVSKVTVRNFAGDGLVLRGAGDSVVFCTATGNRNGVRVSGSNADVHGTFANNREAGVWVMPGVTGAHVGAVTPSCPTSAGGIAPAASCPLVPGEVFVDGNQGAGVRFEGDQGFLDGIWAGLTAGNGGDGILITGTGNALTGSVSSRNGGNGISLTQPLDTFVQTYGTCNARLFLDAGNNGPTANDLPDLDDVLNAPHLTSAVDDYSAVTITGTLDAAPDAMYRIDISGQPSSCKAVRLGSSVLTTNHSGLAAFRIAVAKETFSPVPRVAAIATLLRAYPSNMRFETSELSNVAETVRGEPGADLTVSITAPATAPAWTEIPFEIHVTNHGPAALYSMLLLVPHAPNTQYSVGTTTTGPCLFDIGTCGVGPIGAGETAIVRGSVVVMQPGPFDIRVEAEVSVSPLDPLGPDLNPADNTAVAHVLVGKPTRVRAARR
jgi:hypothetical protein